MKFIADLHIHSKFSRATAKNLDLENLYIAAQLKGITVISTGDVTHPGWFAEIKEKLIPAEEGLFKLKSELSEKYDKQVPLSCRSKVRFMLNSEISSIYKKNGKTRKNHNLVFLPDLDTAHKFNTILDKIGNIKSDGRPILGLDAKDLLQILLDTSDKAFLIPAHIWTPWFSVLGSKSGFDSIDECFEDLTPHIFAVETGLSSDPGMNWCVSKLDGLTLISNSDAHSPLKLGREANLFDTDLSYPAIKSAIKTGNPKQFLGTFEFFPEEGKYHLDGHRKCKICLSPEQTIKNKEICPVCGKPLTLGVLYRVKKLADRPDGIKPENAHPYHCLIPLTEILSELLNVGPASKRVMTNYNRLLEKFGPELAILHNVETDILSKGPIPLLGEAVKRIRSNNIKLIPGYDGEYGSVKIFKPAEKEKLLGQKSLFQIPDFAPEQKEKSDIPFKKPPKLYKKKPELKAIKPDVIKSGTIKSDPEIAINDLNPRQREAVEYKEGPLLIAAGPGTGKTRTLTHRIAYLIKEKKVLPENILAVTFTNKAAQEMTERLTALIKNPKLIPLASTFHAICFKILNDIKDTSDYTIIDENNRKFLITEAIKQVEQNNTPVTFKPDLLLKGIISAKQQILEPFDDLETVVEKNKTKTFSSLYESYQNLLTTQDLFDYEDLIFNVVKHFETDQTLLNRYKERFKYIFVDEYQDINQGQYRIIKALAPSNSNICVIGDPDQSIYGFRGSDVLYFKKFKSDYPEAGVINLTRNYRSAEAILQASYQVIKDHSIHSSNTRIYSEAGGIKTISILERANAKAEAETTALEIEKLIGGTGFYSIDSGRIADASCLANTGFSDFAVLYRTGRQGKIFAEIFEKHGIPCQIVSRDNLFNAKGILELISLLKVADGHGCYLDLERVIGFLKPGIGGSTFAGFKNWCYKNRLKLKDAMYQTGRLPIPGLKKAGQIKLNDFFKRLFMFQNKINNMTIENKLHYLAENTKFGNILEKNPETGESFNKLITISKKYNADTLNFLATAALHTDTDVYDFTAEKVSLMTMHAAKGLEFNVVFIAGCENGYIPFERPTSASFDIPFDVNEERRLFYVAMTRAKERLYLTCAKKRSIYGKQVTREISPFVADIESRLKKHEKYHMKNIKKQIQTQIKLF